MLVDCEYGLPVGLCPPRYSVPGKVTEVLQGSRGKLIRLQT